MLPVGGDRRAFQAGRIAACEPQLGGPDDRGALAVGGVRSGTDGDPYDRVVGVGVALLREGLDVAVAVLVDVVDDPGLLHLAVGAFPASLAD
jgi:hypothetical protein